jgi:hypothetical protein
MMEAARMAAEAAVREATARDADTEAAGQLMQPMDMDPSSESEMMMGMDGADQFGLLSALQAAELGDQADIFHDINMMGLNPHGGDVESLLQMLQKQQEQENARPDEHYLTIAQNGRCYTDSLDYHAFTVFHSLTVWFMFVCFPSLDCQV